MQKGKSLANRLLSKKASRRTDKLTFGSNAQVHPMSLNPKPLHSSFSSIPSPACLLA